MVLDFAKVAVEESIKQQEEALIDALRKARDICVALGIIGKSTEIAGDYVKFEFTTIPQHCKECGRVL